MSKEKIQAKMDVHVAKIAEAAISMVTSPAEEMGAKIYELIKEAIATGVEIGAEAGAEVGAAAAIKAIENEKKKIKKQEQDYRHHNTKLLLRNYRRLNAFYKEAVFNSTNAEEIDESFEQIMKRMGRPKDETVFVESIQKNYITTRTIMTHVDKMLSCYKIMCQQSNKPEDARRWRVLSDLYICGAHISAEQIAQKEHIDRRTVYRYIDTCVDDLTVMFFGAGGLDNL